MIVLVLQLIGSLGLETSVLSHTELKQLINQQEEEASYLLPSEIGFTKVPRLLAPLLSAHAALAIDPGSGAIFYKKNAFERLPIASITKVMTALIVFERVGNLKEVVKVGQAASDVPGSRVGLVPSEHIAVIDLLRALLIGSGNDAAYALAYGTGDGKLNSFVEAMNKKATDLGLRDTHFSNPAGFDDDENYSTAHDLSLLARMALRNQVFKEIIGIKDMTIFSKDGTHSHRLVNTNQLLGGYLSVIGVKTGRTKEAGQSLLSLANRDGKKVLAIVLNSPDRFQESKALLDWVYAAFKWPEGPVG